MLTVGELRIAIDGLPDDLAVIILVGDESEQPRPMEIDRLSIDRDGFLDFIVAKD